MLSCFTGRGRLIQKGSFPVSRSFESSSCSAFRGRVSRRLSFCTSLWSRSSNIWSNYVYYLLIWSYSVCMYVKLCKRFLEIPSLHATAGQSHSATRWVVRWHQQTNPLVPRTSWNMDTFFHFYFWGWMIYWPRYVCLLYMKIYSCSRHVSHVYRY